MRWIWLAIFLIALGCGTIKEDPLTPVSGTAKFRGKPLADTEIVFLPIEGTIGAGGSGKTDSSGAFSLNYQRSGKPGVPPGKYKVIAKKTQPDKSGGEITTSDGTYTIPGKDMLPPSLSDPGATKVVVTVPEGGGKTDVEFK